MKNDLVVKKNVLINAKYSLSPLELKIVLAVVSRINKNDTEFKEYIVPVPELNSDYKDIQKASKSLMQKVFEINTENGWLMMIRKEGCTTKKIQTGKYQAKEVLRFGKHFSKKRCFKWITHNIFLRKILI